MPYKKFRSGTGWKVWKVDEEGKKVGEPMSNKPLPEDKADAQVRALYANEKKPKKEAEDLEPVAGEEVETKEAKMYDDETAYCSPFGGACSWDEMDAHEQAQEMAEHASDMNYKFRVMADNIIRNPMMEDKAQALADLAKGYAERIKQTDEEKTLLKQIAGDNQSPKPDTSPTQNAQEPETTPTPGEDSHKDTQSLYIWKEGETYKWLAAYSNNRRDSDNPPEIISSESHKEFDAALHNKEWPMPELWIWHIPLAVGRTTYHAYDEANGFPLAGGVFNKGFEWVAEGLEKAGWNGVSHGMPSEWIQRDPQDDTIITRHRTKEISILPQWAAANKLAFNIISKESDMADQEKALPEAKKTELISAFGDNAKQFLEAVENTSKEADDAGIEKKETEVLTPDNPIVKALGDIVASLASLEQRLKALEEKPTAEEKEEPFDLVAFLQGKSAIGKPETKVDGRSTLAKDKPEEAPQESFTQSAVGIRLSLADQLVQANQQYYAERGKN